MTRVLFALFALVVATLPVVAAPAQAEPDLAWPTTPTDTGRSPEQRADNLLHPRAAEKNTLRQEAVDRLASQDARLVGRGEDRAILLDDGTKVDYPVSRTAQLLTFLIEFGGTGEEPTTYGPQAGTIPKPEESDNSTYWKPSTGVGTPAEDLGFDREHFMNMFFDGMPEQDGESFRDLYREMSSGKFRVEGDVSDWVEVDRPEAYYGENLPSGDEDPERLSAFVQDGADAWYEAELAKPGASESTIQEYLAEFDVWDRYDADGDGNYNEPDGYIDHFQAVHAGIGEEAGGEEWTIWSQRNGASWWTPTGPEPSAGCACAKQGGVEIGDSGYYILDFTTEPENGGLGIFAHEFAHDLGLPDYYDTQGGDNSTAFWTLMSSGSWLGHGAGSTGTTPNHMGATEKYFLGWYGPSTGDGGFADLAVVDGLAEEPQEVVLGPSYRATNTGAQAVQVRLPDGRRTLEAPFPATDDGALLYSGGRANNALVGANSPEVTITPGSTLLTADVAYHIEPDYDFAFLRASTDDGENWVDVPTSLSVAGTTCDPFSPTYDCGINGVSGHPGAGEGWEDLDPTWQTLEADLGAFTGETIRLRWEYYTDGRTLGDGFAVDNVEIGSLSTGYETVDDWTLQGFHHVVEGSYEDVYPQYYLAENRQYRGYDSTLETGPYSSNYDNSSYWRVDHFPYQDGLLIWYANGFYADNNSSQHPGGGAALPVDANPEITFWLDDEGDLAMPPPSGRIQAYDATFDVDRTDALEMTREVAGSPEFDTIEVPAQQSVPVFEDSDPDAYLDARFGPPGLMFSTEVSGLGAMIQVASSDETTGRMVLKVGARFVAATGAPEIDGDAVVGQTLSAIPPTWFQDDVAVELAWLRDGQPIPGADELEYELTAADADTDVSVAFTGSKVEYTSTTVESAALAVPRAAAPAASTPAKIAGTARVGETLTATGATWPQEGTSSFAWTVGGAAAGNGTSYVVKPADLGAVVTLTETRRTTGHQDATSTASTTAVAAGAAPVASGVPKIKGNAKPGARVRVTGATWPQPGTSTFAWKVGGKQVGTGTSYVVRVRDAGKRLSVTETRAVSGYLSGTATSKETRVKKAPVRIRVKVGNARPNRPVRVTVHVTHEGRSVPGRVGLKYADLDRTRSLVRGKVSVRLPARPRGTHKLEVKYGGTAVYIHRSKNVDVRVR